MNSDIFNDARSMRRCPVYYMRCLGDGCTGMISSSKPDFEFIIGKVRGKKYVYQRMYKGTKFN